MDVLTIGKLAMVLDIVLGHTLESPLGDTNGLLCVVIHLQAKLVAVFIKVILTNKV